MTDEKKMEDPVYLDYNATTPMAKEVWYFLSYICHFIEHIEEKIQGRYNV